MAIKPWLRISLMLSFVLIEAQSTNIGFTPTAPIFGGQCFLERRNRLTLFQSIWNPTCSLFGAWTPEQCDVFGDCWCVDIRNGQPLSQRMHGRGEINCYNTMKYCNLALNEEFRYCISQCDRKCNSVSICSQTCPSLPRGTRCNNGNCYNRCTCPLGWMRNERGECVERCPVPECVEKTMIYSDCAGCIISCEDRHNPPPCPSVCRQRCTCPENTFLHQGRCVPESFCPVLSTITPLVPQSTPEASVCNSSLNEELRECAPPCDATCIEPFKPCSQNESCHQRCACADGNVRDVNNVCVDQNQCIFRRRDRSELTPCLAQRQLDLPRFATECDASGYFNTTQCGNEACYCVNKYSGELLEGTRMPKNDFFLDCEFLGDCPKHMSYSPCAAMCPPTCDDPVPKCKRGCAFDCFCPKGMVRMTKSNLTCVPIQECPKPHSCKYMQDTAEFGETVNCNVERDSAAHQCNSSGICWCLDDNGTIIPDTVTTIESFGNGTICDQSKDLLCNSAFGEVFNPCSTNCDATCSDSTIKCSLSKICTPRCACPTNWLRNDDGKCIPKENCPKDSLSKVLNKITDSKDSEKRKNTTRSETSCERERNENGVESLFDTFIPECDENGLYVSKQCYGFLKECWCVNKIWGFEMDGSRHNQFNPDYSIDCENYDALPPASRVESEVPSVLAPVPGSYKPDILPLFPLLVEGGSPSEENLQLNFFKTGACEIARSRMTSLQQPDSFIPQCDNEGWYERRQCDDNHCWCVKKTSGEEMEGSRVSLDDRRNRKTMDCENYSTEELALNIE